MGRPDQFQFFVFFFRCLVLHILRYQLGANAFLQQGEDQQLALYGAGLYGNQHADSDFPRGFYSYIVDLYFAGTTGIGRLAAGFEGTDRPQPFIDADLMGRRWRVTRGR